MILEPFFKGIVEVSKGVHHGPKTPNGEVLDIFNTRWDGRVGWKWQNKSLDGGVAAEKRV